MASTASTRSRRMPTTRTSPTCVRARTASPSVAIRAGCARTAAPIRTRPSCEARGQVLPDLNYKTNPFVTHTDAPFNHYSHDINVFVTLDKPFRQLLASGNFEYVQDGGDPIGVENEHSMIEMEWERSGVPFFAYPAQSDRITVWGPHVWDCGHGEVAHRLRHTIPTTLSSTQLPHRDPLARRLGVVPQHRRRQRPRPGPAGGQEGPGPVGVVRGHRPQGRRHHAAVHAAREHARCRPPSPTPSSAPTAGTSRSR